VAELYNGEQLEISRQANSTLGARRQQSRLYKQD